MTTKNWPIGQWTTDLFDCWDDPSLCNYFYHKLLIIIIIFLIKFSYYYYLIFFFVVILSYF